MRVRKRLRRIKRVVYLGGIVGAGFAVRQAKARRDAHTNLGPPSTWPPLEASEPPVAAVGDLVTAAEATEADPGGDVETPAPDTLDRSAPVDDPVVSDEPVAAVGEIAAEDTSAWVAPDNGSCPVSHPIKASAKSGIYHVPGSQFYARTRAERCYEDAAAAEADGYRAAKSS